MVWVGLGVGVYGTDGVAVTVGMNGVGVELTVAAGSALQAAVNSTNTSASPLLLEVFLSFFFMKILDHRSLCWFCLHVGGG